MKYSNIEELKQEIISNKSLLDSKHKKSIAKIEFDNFSFTIVQIDINNSNIIFTVYNDADKENIGTIDLEFLSGLMVFGKSVEYYWL